MVEDENPKHDKKQGFHQQVTGVTFYLPEKHEDCFSISFIRPILLEAAQHKENNFQDLYVSVRN